jgi:hypothetical protein
MKSLRISTLLKLALLASDAMTTIVLVSSYTFDPMNNTWRSSSTRRDNNMSHHSSSSASSYSYAPAEPTPAAGLELTYSEEDIVRHHYTAWGVVENAEENDNDPAFVPKQTLVEIQYNKKTGEVSLLDEEGVVTPEEYQRLMKAVKYENEGDGGHNIDGIAALEQRLHSQERQEDIAVGTTLYLDSEDLDPTDIIDTESQALSVEDNDGSLPVATTTTVSRQQDEIHHYAQQLQDYPEPSTQYHHSEDVSTSTETYNSYSIPQPATETNYPVQQYQHYQYSHQPMQTASSVAEPTAEQYYQQQAAHQHSYAEYYPTSVAEQPVASTNDETTTEEEYEDDSTYRSSRGFGFASRREFFYGTE